MAYTYLFQTSGFSSVDEIRAELESQGDWDYAASEKEAQDNQHIASRKFGFCPPYDREQQVLGTYLVDKKAGPLISTYAWGLLAEKAVPQRKSA